MEEDLLPKPFTLKNEGQTDLPPPEKEISEHTTPASQGLALRSYRSKWVKLGIVAVLVLFIAGGAYLLGKNNSSKQSQTLTATPTPTTAQDQTGNPNLDPGEPKDETADWKTYSDSKDSYSFKYLQNWYINGDNSQNTHNSVGISPLKLQEVDGATSNIIAFNVIDNPDNLSVENYVKQKIYPGTVNYSSVKIDGIEGKRTADLPGQFDNDQILISYQSKIYTITLIKAPGLQISSSTFDQILSTFRFD